VKKSSITERFNALPVVQKIRAYLNAFDYFGAGDPRATKALEEIARLRASQEAPSVPPVRLGNDQIYCGNAFGVPAVATERSEEEIAGDEAFEVSKAVTAEKIRLGLAKPMKSAAGVTRPEMTKSVTFGIPAAGNAGPQPAEPSGLLRDPDYVKARDRGDTEAMARIAAEFGRRK